MLKLNQLLNILFPSKCPVCGSNSDSHIHNPICSACWSAIVPFDGYSCNICGRPAVSPHIAHCEECMKDKPPFEKILYYGIYEGALREAIHLLKFNNIKRLSAPLSSLLMQLPLSSADAVIPVPLCRKNLLNRGFNQTADIAYHLSKKLKISLMLNSLHKMRETLPQTDVSGKERLKNLKGAFAAEDSVRGLNLFLLDDVITTGSTVSECSRELLKKGAKSVTVIAVARSMPKM
jgi:ComF family protein